MYVCSKEVGAEKDINTCSDIYDLEKLTVRKGHNLLRIIGKRGDGM
jgi:hypothetical protein